MELIKIRFGEEPDAIEAAVDRNLTDLYRSANLLFSCSDCLWLPSMDMIETPKEIVIISEIAGLEKEDLEVEITRRAVKVSGRRRPPPRPVRRPIVWRKSTTAILNGSFTCRRRSTRTVSARLIPMGFSPSGWPNNQRRSIIGSRLPKNKRF